MDAHNMTAGFVRSDSPGKYKYIDFHDLKFHDCISQSHFYTRRRDTLVQSSDCRF
jgi:hypothetical protein